MCRATHVDELLPHPPSYKFYAQAKDGFVERGRAVHAAAREAALYGS